MKQNREKLELVKELNNKIEELNKKLYMALQKEYEYLNGDEVIVEEFKANEYFFMKMAHFINIKEA